MLCVTELFAKQNPKDVQRFRKTFSQTEKTIVRNLTRVTRFLITFATETQTTAKIS